MAATNVASQFSSDIENYIQEKTLPLARRQLVAYQFGDKLRLPSNRGTTYTASRYDRLNLPAAPLSEGVPPVGETMPLAQVSVTAQQWGDKVTITDVADLTIKHPLFQKAIDLCALALAETLERNTFTTLMSGSQVNYVNTRGARASLVAGDVMNIHEINRSYAALLALGAPRYDGDQQEDQMIDADAPTKASSNPRSMPHYVSLIHPLVAADLRENPTIVTAWSYSDINRLYNAEIGEFGGMRFCQSNMVPFFVGVTTTTTPTVGTSGSLTTGTYKIQWVGLPTQQNYEQQIYQASAGAAVVGPNGSLTTTTPNVAGFVWNVYISGAGLSTFLNLAATSSAAAPQVGPLAGMAAQIPSNTVITLTALGNLQTAPSAPANGVTVYPNFFIGQNAYGQVMLDDARFTYLKTADKSDPLNQLRVIGWKVFYGTLIENNLFFCRTESSSAFSTTFG